VAAAFTVMQLLPALNAGGVERSVIETAQALVRDGHRAIVVSAGGRLMAELEALGAEHIVMPIGKKSLSTLRMVGKLRQVIETTRPHIVHARSRLPAWVAHLALRGLRETKPVFVTSVHGLNSPGRYSAILTSGIRVECVSGTVRDYVVKHYPRLDPQRLRVIERGIDPTQFPRGFRASLTWRERFHSEHPELAGRPILLLPGRGTRLKGHTEAITLLAALLARGLDPALLLQGAQEEGRERYISELREHAKALGVEDRLVIAPPRSDIREVMAGSALVLQLSSKPEAFGRTVAEALSLGKPVLGWNHGGTGELLARHFPQGAIAPFDADALAQRAAELLSNPVDVPGFTGTTLEQMQAATLALYHEALVDSVHG
jgi:glycosyltransferase involved in cell wall biosynthesis